MKIVIPMSGEGRRFKKAGYTTLKPLIAVEGRPVIGHVVDLFPGERDVVFICNREHLEGPGAALEGALLTACPTARIVAIAPHRRGPVHAVLEAASVLEDDEPTIVNYCDFSAYWSYVRFRSWLREADPDGCVTCYTGFHPHLLREGVYAGMRVAPDGRLLEIREKHRFTADPTEGHHSAGTYYFKTGRLVRRYFQRLVERGPSVGGEFYVSSVYEHLLADGLDVRAYVLEYFLQWGTPESLEDYLAWSEYFRRREESERTT